MDIIDELSARRQRRADQMAAEDAERRQLAQQTRRLNRAERMARFGATVNNNVKWFIGLITAIVCAWSLATLGREVGMPGWVGLLAAMVIDGAWLYCLLQTHLNRDTPYRALGAHTTAQFLLAVSVACNLLHGLASFGVTWKGWLAGALFALFPVVLKVVVSQSSDNPIAHLLKVPGGRAAIRQMGRDRAQSALTALQQHDVIDRYQIGRRTELEMARFDVESEAELAGLASALGLSGQLRTPDISRPDTAGQDPDSVRTQQIATPLTGPDAVRTARPDTRSQTEIIRDLLDSGTPRELVFDEVLKIKPDAKEDSVRRAMSRELRSGNHI